MYVEKAEMVQECLDHCRAQRATDAVLEAANESD